MHTRHILALMYLAGLFALPSCNPSGPPSDTTVQSPDSDPSIVFSEWTVSPKVENGTAYDKASIYLGPAKKLIVPANATVRQDGEAGVVELLLGKTLSFGGHPPEPVSVRTVRAKMGCAVRLEGHALLVATYGVSNEVRTEGGAWMKVVVVVPEGFPVEQRKGLSGSKSPAPHDGGMPLSHQKDGNWFGPAAADGWARVPTVPDPKHRAGKQEFKPDD